MILAAGRGARMGHLTDRIPKPLLKVGEQSLIEHHLVRLHAAGFSDVVINVAYRAHDIQHRLGDGSAWKLRIRYSHEAPEALETGGGIVQALPLLGSKPFAVINSDIWTDFDFARLRHLPPRAAHVVLVSNPPHKPRGDFGLRGTQVVAPEACDGQTLTFAGMGVYQPELFAGRGVARFPLASLLREAIREDRVSGEHFTGCWIDVGTSARLAQANRVAATQQIN